MTARGAVHGVSINNNNNLAALQSTCFGAPKSHTLNVNTSLRVQIIIVRGTRTHSVKTVCECNTICWSVYRHYSTHNLLWLEMMYIGKVCHSLNFHVFENSCTLYNFADKKKVMLNIMEHVVNVQSNGTIRASQKV